MKKVISLILVIACIVSVFSSCAQTVEEKHLAKGEFFNIFLNSFNYYPDDCTLEEMNENGNYDVEAATMVSWDILSEDEATKGLDSAITKEIAVLSCLNAMTITKEGNTDDIKDADLCKHPQEMANAYATGIVELDNGYINGQEKLTLGECNALIEKTISLKASSHYEEDEGTIKYGDISFFAEDLNEDSYISVEGYEKDTDAINLINTDQEPLIASMDYKKSSSLINAENMANLSTFKVKLSKDLYNKYVANAQPGDVISYNGLELPNKKDLILYKGNLPQPFIGRFVECVDYDSYYVVTLKHMTSVEKMSECEIVKKTYKVNNLHFEKLEKKIGDFELKLTEEKGKITIKVKKAFKLKESKYNNWRDATADPVAEFTGTIDNICLDINNVKNIFKEDGGDASVKLTCNTSQTFVFESGLLRLAPDSNRNGKFWSNLTNSRFTSAKKGATEVKIARVTASAYGIDVEFYVFLDFHMDGKITIRLSQQGNGFELEKKNGKLTVNSLLESRERNVNVQANLDVGIQLDVTVGFVHVIDVISCYLKLGADVAAAMSLYYEVDGKDKKEDLPPFGDPVEASEAVKEDKKLKYCFDYVWAVYLRGELKKDNLIGEIAGAFGYDLSKCKFELRGGKNAEWLPNGSGHLEEKGIVDECTRGDSVSAEEAKNVSDEDKFLLSEYKVYLPENTCDIVYITYMPISDKKIKSKYKGGIKVRVKNKSVVKAEYMESNNSVMITAIQPGSTEVEVYVQKDKKSGKEYLQSFSVTVQGETNNIFNPLKEMSVSPWEKIFEA